MPDQPCPNCAAPADSWTAGCAQDRCFLGRMRTLAASDHAGYYGIDERDFKMSDLRQLLRLHDSIVAPLRAELAAEPARVARECVGLLQTTSSEAFGQFENAKDKLRATDHIAVIEAAIRERFVVKP